MTLILAMAGFALSMSISPGPVNLITLSSGARNGLIKTLPFVTGATTGFTLMFFIVGLGAGRLVLEYPSLMKAIGYGGSGFILYLAFKIATSRPDIALEKTDSPGFLQGALLQWLNPKAWIACLSGGAAFITTGEILLLLQFCLIYYFVCYGSVFCWAMAGVSARRFLQNEKNMRLFNLATGSLLGLVAIYLFTTL